MDELEAAVRTGSREKRVDALRRITDLFLVAPSMLSKEQIGLFDDVLSHLVARVETRARADLANRLAPVTQAPTDVIRQLARDDEIAVAGPVLTKSTCLSTSDLVDIAQQKSQAHLLAIAGRETVAEQVTDVLVRRGNREIIHTLSANFAAAFSQEGYSTLVKRAEGDESLTEKIGRRLDIPLPLFRDLLLRATDTVRARLMASASPEKQDVISKILANISQEIESDAPMARNFESAQRQVALLKETGRLNESEIETFAKHEKYEETIAGIAGLCGVPLDLIERLSRSGRTDALLVPCKAAGLAWPTVRAILELCGRRKALGHCDIELASQEFAKLSAPTAARVLRFWQVRQTTVGQVIEQGVI
jgi:uncharacterized protein (DUF2336 family)